MPINHQQLARLNADYSTLTRQPIQGFVCPITLQDDPHAELCDGHVVNDGIKKASKATVIQRKDVDGYFGRTIEPDLVQYLNVPVLTRKELFQKVRGLQITGPTGEKMDTFFANSSAREKFQQIDLYDPDGATFASPFLRTHKLEAKRYNDLEVEWTMTFTNSAIVASLLKSGYLALFRMLGYRWVFDVAGDKVRRSLAAFHREGADKEQSHKYFAEFNGSISIILNDALKDEPDTLEGGSLLFHYVYDDHVRELMFALTCLFRMNSRVWTVTLPCYQMEGYYFVAYQHYQKFLKDRSMPQSVHFGQFKDGQFDISTSPMQLRYQVTP